MASQEEGQNKESKKLQKSYFDVLGICCPSEIPLVENILKPLDGVKEFSIIVPSRTVIVVHDSLLISQLQIAKALNQAMLEASVRLHGDTAFKKKWPSPFAVVSGVLLSLSFLKYVYGPFRWLAVGAVAAGIFPIFAKSLASIRRFRLDINILALIAVIGTIAMKDYTEAGTVVFLFSIAEWLESRASHKASAVMLSLMSLAPQKAIIAETGEEVEVDEVNLNTILAIKAGETIPIDGIVVDGNCEVDEKTLTGEPFPVSKEKDSTVWAGTINLNGYISVKTTALAEDCVIAQMTKLVEEAQNSKTRTQRFIDKYSQYYTPAIVIVSACFAVIPAALRVHNLNHWFHLALVVLVSACPCGLILSTPVATFCALTKAATSGLLIKGGDYLETLAKIKVVAFDKTGTITRGEFVVMDFRSLCQDISLRNLLYWVSSIESKSSHPMASTLVDYSKSVSVRPMPESVEDYRNFPGEGVYGKIHGRDVFIGNKRIALRAGCSTVPNLEREIKGGKTVGYIYVGERLVGIFNLSDACRSGVAQGIEELKSLGIKIAMLTGDNEAAAMHAQEQLANALEIVHAELLPEDKAKIITEFKKEGPTAMVGDGMNDAPALAMADIGISMGISGSALATETGHIILMSNDIRKIPKAVKLARKAQRKVIENVVLSITIKGGILGLAFAGHPLVWAAVLADVGTCLLVIFNSMLLLRDKYKPADKCYRASSSMFKTQKLEGDDSEDLEAGLLRRADNDNCNLGCGNKNQQEKEKTVEPKHSDSNDGLQMRKDESCNSGCCGYKTQQENVKIVRQRCFEEPAELETGLKMKNGGNCDSDCCRSKQKQVEDDIIEKNCCEKPAELKRGRQTNDGENCKSGCFVNKNEEAKQKIGAEISVKQPAEIADLQITGQSSLEKHEGFENEARKKSSGNCKSGCCGDKHREQEPVDLGQGRGMNKNKICNSGCCGNSMTAKKPAVSEQGQISNKNEICKACCCGNNQKSKPADSEQGQSSNKNEICKAGCCGSNLKANKAADSEQGQRSNKNEIYNLGCSGANQTAEDCADAEQDQRSNKNGNCKSGCGRNNQTPKKPAAGSEQGQTSNKEEICSSVFCSNNQTAKTSVGSAQSQRSNKNEICNSGCCGNNQTAKESTDSEQGQESNKNEIRNSGCFANSQAAKESADSEQRLKKKSSGSCRSECCSSNELELKRYVLEQSCCSKPADPKAGFGMKNNELCMSNCAKECCTSRQVGASGFGKLTEIVIE